VPFDLKENSKYIYPDSPGPEYQTGSFGLAVVLVFVGIKMLIIDFYKIPIGWSLIFIATIITGSIILSLKIKRTKEN